MNHYTSVACGQVNRGTTKEDQNHLPTITLAMSLRLHASSPSLPGGGRKLTQNEKNILQSVLKKQLTTELGIQQLNLVDTIEPGDLSTDILTICSERIHASSDSGYKFEIEPISHREVTLSMLGIDSVDGSHDLTRVYKVDVPYKHRGLGIQVTPAPEDSLTVMKMTNTPFLVLEQALLSAANSNEQMVVIDSSAVAFFVGAYLGARKISVVSMVRDKEVNDEVKTYLINFESDMSDSKIDDHYSFNGRVAINPEAGVVTSIHLSGIYQFIFSSAILTTQVDGSWVVRVERSINIH